MRSSLINIAPRRLAASRSAISSVQRVTTSSVSPSLARTLSSLPSSSSSSSSIPLSSSSSFLSRHPAKITLGVVAIGGSAFALSRSFSSKAAPVPIPPFSLSDYSSFASLDDFKRNQDIVLYQYETCPFCNKLRAFLDYSQIHYRLVEVNPLTKSQKKDVRGLPQLSQTKEVPVLVINGHILTDSTPTIKNVNEIMNLYRTNEEKYIISPEEHAAFEFIDKRVVNLTALNIYSTWSDAMESFNYIAKNSQLRASSYYGMQSVTKWVGAFAMYWITELKLKKKYNIKDPRKAMYDAIDEWIAGNPGPFRGGSLPSIADIALFGVFRSLQPYETGREIMKAHNTSREFVQWYNDIEQIMNRKKLEMDQDTERRRKRQES